jgi:hypothetical protein
MSSVTVGTTLNVTTLGQTHSGNKTLVYTNTGSQVAVGPQLIGTSAFVPLSSSFTNVDYARFTNTNTSSSKVIVATDISGSSVVTTLYNGRSSVISCSGSITFYAKAETSASWLDYLLLPK